VYVVTGLTRMNQGRICMSVYDTDLNRYLRPIPPNNRYSDQDLQLLTLFSVVNLNQDNRIHLIQAPHTEDFPVTNQHLQPVRMLTRVEQLTLLRGISVQSTYDIFGFQGQEPILKQRGIRNYVLPGSGTRSLGTVTANTVRVYYNYGRIKVDFTDTVGNTFTDIPFVCNENIDPDELTLQLRRSREKYVRLSLARQFRPNNWDFDACFLQVSCIHGY